jgi:hypothetical protein
MKDALGNRIKRYEAATNYRLTPQSPPLSALSEDTPVVLSVLG